jgi:hypothetical protein
VVVAFHYLLISQVVVAFHYILISQVVVARFKHILINLVSVSVNVDDGQFQSVCGFYITSCITGYGTILHPLGLIHGGLQLVNQT